MLYQHTLYLQKNNFEYRIDSSNDENDFERNFIRNKIIPLIKERLNKNLNLSVLKFSENMRYLTHFVTKSVVELAKEIIEYKNDELIIKLSNKN